MGIACLGLTNAMNAPIIKIPHGGILNGDDLNGYEYALPALRAAQGAFARGIQAADEPAQPHRGADPRHPRHGGNGAYCPDILVQSAAVNAAINAFNRELLASHIRTCVRSDIQAGNDEVIDELLSTLQKLMK